MFESEKNENMIKELTKIQDLIFLLLFKFQ